MEGRTLFKMSEISKRKKDHIRITLSDESQYQSTNGLDKYGFYHNALPELDLSDVSINAVLADTIFDAPIFISSMTGGYSGGESVNKLIAEICESENLPMGVGSQRAMIEDSSQTFTFSSARKSAPKAWIAANIGGCQIRLCEQRKQVQTIIDAVEANALIIHLNPLQELVQPEGDRNFSGILSGIESLKSEYQLPLIVKETGAGLSSLVIDQLIEVGVDIVDVAASGGTSWSKVENLRSEKPYPIFNEWGIPLDKILTEQYNRDRSRYQLIASGGIRTSLDILKSLCLGADFTAAAQPIIKTILEQGQEALSDLIKQWKNELKVGMCLLGCAEINQLCKNHLYLK